MRHKSGIKAHKQSLVRAARNTSLKSRVKTFIKKAESAIDTGVFSDSVLAVRKAESQTMRAVSKGVLKLNTASRRVSSLVKKLKKLESKTQEA